MALASVWPCLELLARCVDPDPATSRRGHATMRKVVTHTGYVSGSELRLGLHEAGEYSLVRGLFGIELEDPLLEMGLVGSLAVAAAEAPLEQFRMRYSEVLAEIAERVRLEEEQFTAMTTAGLAAFGRYSEWRTVPTRVDLSLLAAGLVQVLAERHGVDLEEANAGALVEAVVRHFAVALGFLYGFMRDSGQSRGVVGRGNSAWDLKVAFHAALGGSVNGAPVVLVSDDGRLVRAGHEGGEPLRVMRITEYKAMLQTDGAIGRRAAALRRIVPDHR